jgi:hypothetical protein
MAQIQEIYNEYTQMRQKGQEAKVVLNTLRSSVEALTKPERAELASLLRAWEAQPVSESASVSTTPTEPRKPSPIKPIKPAATPGSPMPSVVGSAISDGPVELIACPNCKKTNQKTEVFCYACGQLLEPIQGLGDTRHFDGPSSAPLDSEYFGYDSVLALRVRGSADVYETRPQRSDHEIVIGRGTEGSAITPDIDLGDKSGADLGVSRMHLAIRYDTDHQTVLVTDLGSANGSFINGQRMLSKEVRVLRHGDELRLGKLVMVVSFRHPDKTGAK